MSSDNWLVTYLKVTLDLAENDAYVIIALSDFVGVTIHRESGVTELVRYFRYDAVLAPFHPRLIPQPVRNLLIYKLATHQNLSPYVAAKFLAVNIDFVNALVRDPVMKSLSMLSGYDDFNAAQIYQYDPPSMEG